MPGRPVAGAGRVAAVGRPRVGGRRRRRRGCGRSASRGGARRCGPGRGSRARGRATQRSLLTVVAATGTTPVASAQACAPSSSTRSSAAAAERVSFHSSAGAHDLAGLVEQHHAVLLAADGERRRRRRGGRRRSPPRQAVHQWRGSTSVPSGWAARPARTTSPVSASHTTTLHDWVEVSTPATSGRSVICVLPDGGCGGRGTGLAPRSCQVRRAAPRRPVAYPPCPGVRTRVSGPGRPRSRGRRSGGRPRRCWPGSTGRPRPSRRPRAPARVVRSGARTTAGSMPASAVAYARCCSARRVEDGPGLREHRRRGGDRGARDVGAHGRRVAARLTGAVRVVATRRSGWTGR